MSTITSEDINVLVQAVERLADLLQQAPQPSASAMTVEQAAARLGASRSRVFELLKKGDLLRAKRHGRRVLITVASLDALGDVPVEKLRPLKQPKVKRSGADIRAGILKLRKKP